MTHAPRPDRRPGTKKAPHLARTLALLVVVSMALSSPVPSVAETAPGTALEPQQPEAEPARWARWRGPSMDGQVPAGNPPVEWDEARNVRFKVRVLGLGSGTPIVWGDTMYLLTAIPVAEGSKTDQQLEEWQTSGRDIFQGEAYQTSEQVQQFALVALDRHDGATRWTKVLRTAQPHEGIHPTNSWASGSPVTDGRHIVSFFGSQGIFVTDMEGRLVWEKDLGDLRTRKGWGEGSSPALHGDTIVIPFDHEGPSFLVALDKHNGEEKWRVSREEVTSWFTPLIVDFDGRAQVITTGAERVRSYDLETGELVWHGPGLTVNAIPTPIESSGRIYVTSGFRGEAMYAVDLARARGDIEGTDAILWEYPTDTPYVASPLLYDDTLYFFKGLKGVLTALDTRTGQPVFGPVRLPGVSLVYASPVGVAGRVYAPGREGTTVVFEHGDEFRVLATNELDDTFDASPVVIGDSIYLRGREFLYCIASDGATPNRAAATDAGPAKSASSFPTTWFGRWTGQLSMYGDSGNVQQVPMEVRIGPTDQPDRFEWTLVYGEGNRRQVRPYELVAIDASKGKYEIDEKNSIRLPGRFLGGTFASQFRVGGSWLVSRYRLAPSGGAGGASGASGDDGDPGDARLVFEILTGPDVPRISGGEGAPVVEGFDIIAYQRAELSRSSD